MRKVVQLANKQRKIIITYYVCKELQNVSKIYVFSIYIRDQKYKSMNPRGNARIFKDPHLGAYNIAIKCTCNSGRSFILYYLMFNITP